MKRIILVLAIILCASFVQAAPFLVCDTPTGQVTKYTGTVDGTPFETPYAIHPSGAAIIYDMAPLNLTLPHNFGDLRACNAIGCSDPAVSFTSPTKPVAPVNLRFVN